MPSKEIKDAVGEADKQKESAISRVKRLRTELDAAEKQLAGAEAAMDTDGVIAGQQRVTVLQGFIAKAEREAASEREAEGRQAAEARLLGIKKAYGSLLSEYREDDDRVEQARQLLADAITKRNARASKLEGLEKEADALADRFSLKLPKFEGLTEPRSIELPDQWRMALSRPAIEESEDGTRRSRRTYVEIGRTASYAIILHAGLKPFRPLNDAERDALEHEKAQRAGNEVDPMVASEAAAIAGVPSNMSAYGAAIYRR